MKTYKELLNDNLVLTEDTSYKLTASDYSDQYTFDNEEAFNKAITKFKGFPITKKDIINIMDNWEMDVTKTIKRFDPDDMKYVIISLLDFTNFKKSWAQNIKAFYFDENLQKELENSYFQDD